MGMNYYHYRDVCPTCGRYEREHIGKSSAGWTFLFYGTPEVRSWQEWLRVLEADGEIRDEEGGVVTLDDFKRMVETQRTASLHHARECPVGCWTDPDGHSFSGYEFS